MQQNVHLIPVVAQSLKHRRYEVFWHAAVLDPQRGFIEDILLEAVPLDVGDKPTFYEALLQKHYCETGALKGATLILDPTNQNHTSPLIQLAMPR